MGQLKDFKLALQSSLSPLINELLLSDPKSLKACTADVIWKKELTNFDGPIRTKIEELHKFSSNLITMTSKMK